tara:strand:+ start:149 stop:325 length:177 start_codon:yes stop_codon:yes gene_type:complete
VDGLAEEAAVVLTEPLVPEVRVVAVLVQIRLQQHLPQLILVAVVVAAMPPLVEQVVAA